MNKAIWTKVEEPLDIRVLVPYVKATERLQVVVDCLRIQFVQPELVRVDDGDAYWQLLRDEWARGEEFFIVEHDVLVWPGAIPEMHACPEGWCTLPTICHGRFYSTSLGCARFGKRVIERNPGFWDDIPHTWWQLDAGFANKMGWPYIRPHLHLPSATHLNEVQWPDSISRRWAVARKVKWQSHEAGGAVVNVNYRLEEELPGGRSRWRRRRAEQQQRIRVGPAADLDITIG